MGKTLTYYNTLLFDTSYSPLNVSALCDGLYTASVLNEAEIPQHVVICPLPKNEAFLPTNTQHQEESE